MNLGIFARTFARESIDDVFAAVARHHFHEVHFNFACAGLPSLPETIDPAILDQIRRSALHHRLTIVGVSGTFNLIHPDARHRRDGLRRLGVIAGACTRLGTNLITICTGTRDRDHMWRAHPDNDSAAAWKDLLTSIKKALTLAAKHDVVLGMEPEVGNVVSSARKARRLLDEVRSPRLKIVLDPANLFRPGDLKRSDEILDEAFDLLGADLVMAHAKELSGPGDPEGLPLGKGVLDWDRYLHLLQAVHFAGPLVMHGFSESDVPESLEFLRSKLTS
jgi:sugar phosphate isomerase/epimerase